MHAVWPALVVLAMVSGAPAEEKRAFEWLFQRDSDLYAVYTDSSEARRLTTDGRRKEHITRSPDGSRVAFIADPGRNALGTLVVLSAGGSTLLESAFRPGPSSVGGMRSIEQLEWLTPGRLVISGGFEPTAAEYVVVDANTGRELGAHFVGGFAWSPSPGGAHIAYEYFRPSKLCVDDECRPGGTGGYPARERPLRFHWGPVWSPDGSQLAIRARDGEGLGKEVVIVKRVGGTVHEIAAPFGAGEYIVLSWEGPDLVLASEGLRWKLNADWSEFIRVTRRAPSRQP